MSVYDAIGDINQNNSSNEKQTLLQCKNMDQINNIINTEDDLFVRSNKNSS